MSFSTLLQPNEVVAGRWRIIKQVGEGGFSAIYQARDAKSGEKCALKIESVADKAETVTKMEAAILLQLRGVSAHVCGIMGCGREIGRMHFLVMTLVGRNLGDLRRQRPENRLQSCTVVRLAAQCVQAIQDLHEAGYLHRDIKPTNFAMGRTEDDRRTVYIFDFGLARRYVNEDADRSSDMRPPRESAGFRGTMRYSSFTAHYNGELGRHDDLWSLLYVLIEMRTGSLPWSAIDDQLTVAGMKCNVEMGQLVDSVADVETFDPVSQGLKQLRYHQRPDYDWFKQHLAGIQAKYQYPDCGPFEWEETEEGETDGDDEDGD